MAHRSRWCFQPKWSGSAAFCVLRECLNLVSLVVGRLGSKFSRSEGCGPHDVDWIGCSSYSFVVLVQVPVLRKYSLPTYGFTVPLLPPLTRFCKVSSSGLPACCPTEQGSGRSRGRGRGRGSGRGRGRRNKYTSSTCLDVERPEWSRIPSAL